MTLVVVKATHDDLARATSSPVASVVPNTLTWSPVWIASHATCSSPRSTVVESESVTETFPFAVSITSPSFETETTSPSVGCALWRLCSCAAARPAARSTSAIPLPMMRVMCFLLVTP